MHYFNLKFRARPSAYVSRARKGTDDIVREKCNNIAFFAISVSKNQLYWHRKMYDAVRAEIGVARSDPRHSDRTYRKLPKYASGAPSFRVSEGR